MLNTGRNYSFISLLSSASAAINPLACQVSSSTIFLKIVMSPAVSPLTRSGVRFLSLTENVTVVRGQETVSPGTLTPGMKIRVQLSSAPDEKNNLVDRVEITS